MVGAQLRKYANLYTCKIDFQAEKLILEHKKDGSNPVVIAEKAIDVKKIALFEFANVDRVLIASYGDEKLEYDLGQKPNDLGKRIIPKINTKVMLVNVLKVTLP